MILTQLSDYHTLRTYNMNHFVMQQIRAHKASFATRVLKMLVSRGINSVEGVYDIQDMNGATSEAVIMKTVNGFYIISSRTMCKCQLTDGITALIESLNSQF